MKRAVWLAILLAVVLAIGCGGDDDDNDAVDDDDLDDDADDDDDDDDDSGDDDADDDDDGCDLLYPDLLVSAHRGARLRAPENTLLAFEKAFELGAGIVEMDVRDTLDGEYVLMHDDTVDRTTNGSGTVSEMTLAEIRALEVKTWMYPWIRDTVRVPTFAEALAVVDASGGQAYVDMKTDEPEGAVQVIVDLGLESICFVYSGSVDKLDRARSVSAEVRIQPSTASVDETQALIDHFDPDPEHIEIDGEAGFTPENIALIESIGATISMDALGVRDILAALGYKQAWLGMMEGGIDIIQTDLPGELVEYWSQQCE